MIPAELYQRLESTGARVIRPPDSTVRGGRPPEWVVEPESVDQLATVVRALNEDERGRRALPYPPGPHRQGSLFQAPGYGPVVVELTHTLALAPTHMVRLAVLFEPEPTEELVRCWRELLLQELAATSILTPKIRRRALRLVTTHAGLVLGLTVTAASDATLLAKIEDVRRLAREHGQRTALNASPIVDDLGILGGDTEHPEAVGDLAHGLEWHTATLPFVPLTITAFAKAVRAEPLRAGAWNLKREPRAEMLVAMYAMVDQYGVNAGSCVRCWSTHDPRRAAGRRH